MDKAIRKIKVPKEVSDLIKERDKAREEKDWKNSDDIREKIKKMGFSLEDVDGKTKIIKS